MGRTLSRSDLVSFLANVAPDPAVRCASAADTKVRWLSYAVRSFSRQWPWQWPCLACSSSTFCGPLDVQGARPALVRQATHQRRGAADRGQHAEAAGPVATMMMCHIAADLSRTSDHATVTLVTAPNAAPREGRGIGEGKEDVGHDDPAHCSRSSVAFTCIGFAAAGAAITDRGCVGAGLGARPMAPPPMANRPVRRSVT